MKSIELRVLSLENKEDLYSLQRTLEEAPTYSFNISGELQSPNAAEEMLKALPQGFSFTNKFVLSILENNQMIGCADLLRGFPDTETAMLGLLLISEKYQGKQLGWTAFMEIEKFVLSWKEIQKIRIGIVMANNKVLPFWEKCGFVDTGMRRPYENGKVISETMILEKSIR